MRWEIQVAVYSLIAECKNNDYPDEVIAQKIREFADKLESGEL